MTPSDFKACWRMGFRPAILQTLIKRRLIWKLRVFGGTFYGEVVIATCSRNSSDAGDFTRLYAGERHLPD